MCLVLVLFDNGVCLSIWQVILSGGGTKLQCVIKAIQDKFRSAEISNSIATDEVIAVGAAKQVTYLPIAASILILKLL